MEHPGWHGQDGLECLFTCESMTLTEMDLMVLREPSFVIYHDLGFFALINMSGSRTISILKSILNPELEH